MKEINKLWEELMNGRPYFIAEAGVNHEGDLELGRELIKSAKNSGADAIKFQSYKASTLTTKNAPRFWDYDKEPIKDGSQFDSYSALDSFGKEEHFKLKNICDEYDIEFFSTPFDFESIDYLEDIGVKMYKVASCDLTNFPLLERLAKTGKIIHLSTGAANIDEIKEAVELISKFNEKIVIMHCNLKYPTNDEEANLGMIKDLKNIFGDKYVIGLSDHTTNSMTTAFSWLLGATVYERHYTIDKEMEKTPDHSLVCVDEGGMRELIINTNKAIEMYGEDKKRTTESEERARKYARRSVVANMDIKMGELFTEKNLSCKRPGTGISPKYYFDLIGKVALRDIKFDELINEKDYK